jgi:hypothetical protein
MSSEEKGITSSSQQSAILPYVCSVWMLHAEAKLLSPRKSREYTSAVTALTSGLTSILLRVSLRGP